MHLCWSKRILVRYTSNSLWLHDSSVAANGLIWMIQMSHLKKSDSFVNLALVHLSSCHDLRKYNPSLHSNLSVCELLIYTKAYVTFYSAKLRCIPAAWPLSVGLTRSEQRPVERRAWHTLHPDSIFFPNIFSLLDYFLTHSIHQCNLVNGWNPWEGIFIMGDKLKWITAGDLVTFGNFLRRAAS